MNRKTFLASLLTLPYAIKTALGKKKEDLVVSELKYKMVRGEPIYVIKNGDGEFYTLKWNIVDSIDMPDWVKRISFRITHV